MQEVKQVEAPRYLSNPLTGRAAQVGYVREGAGPAHDVALFTEPQAIEARLQNRTQIELGEFGALVRLLNQSTHSLFKDKVSALLPSSEGKGCEVLAENFDALQGIKTYLAEGTQKGFFSGEPEKLENTLKFILRHEGAHCAHGEKLRAAGLGEAFADAKAVLIGYQEVLRSDDPAKLTVFVEQLKEHIELRSSEADRAHQKAALFLPAILTLAKDEVTAMSLQDIDRLVMKWADEYIAAEKVVPNSSKKIASGAFHELRFPLRGK